MQNTPPTFEQQIHKVSQLNNLIRNTLETNFSSVWVEGEISNLVIPSSGHIYFSLKDATAQVRCVMFRNYSQRLKFQPTNGMHVVIQAQVSLYEARGDYQLISYAMEQSGEGLLHQKFLNLKNKLAAEGIFDEKHKKPLPKLPTCIGIITSPTGAAIRDVLSILKRRFASIPIIIYPTQVQGNEAAKQIVAALQLAQQHQTCDVLILTRGGGSLEDLWPFNEEIVAKAIFANTIPIISAVGHEIDFTIADFVADKRAATPSAAAELVVPDSQAYLNNLLHLFKRLLTFTQNYIKNQTFNVLSYSKRLHHPQYHIQQLTQRFDLIEYQLKTIMKQRLNYYQQNLLKLVTALDLVSPLATLARGYTITSKDDKIITKITELKLGDSIKTKLSDGVIYCNILNIQPTETKN